MASRTATARPPSPAAVKSPYPSVVSVVKLKYWNSFVFVSFWVTPVKKDEPPNFHIETYTAEKISPIIMYALNTPKMLCRVMSGWTRTCRRITITASTRISAVHALASAAP